MYALLLPALAIAAMAMAPAGAQAFEWEVCRNLGAGHKFSDSECAKEVGGNRAWVKLGTTKVQVITFGKLKLTAPGPLVLECKVIDGGNIWNEGGVGKDEITAFTNYECKAEPAAGCPEPEIIAKGLPWKTELIAGPKDKITGIQVTVFCAHVEGPTFKGTLEPTITQPTEAHPLLATFTGTTGELENAKGEKAKVEGKDALITEEDQQVKVK